MSFPVTAPAERARRTATVLWITLGLNWAVALLKVVFGTATHCMVLIADGLHSFTDGASNIVGLVAVTLSGHPADHDHPYGHRKFETMASAIIAIFLFLIAFGILREAAAALFRPRTPEVNVYSFVVMGVTIAVNLFVVFYERRKSRELGSDFLWSDSWHTLSDVFVSLTVVAALIGIRLRLPLLDPVFSLLIALFIIFTAVMVLKRSWDVLVDRAVIDTALVERIVRGVEGVRDCHEIRSRGHADGVYVDLHVLVDNDMTVDRSHRLSNRIESGIRREIPGVLDVVVHVEPVSHDHEEP
ncbi:MAG: hypothetical protein A3D28_04705 [Omnitrophica bacterium RIFCSPHIGHO2_02_FULL_63_14]|nr:MAG: hypothetical protein A3D28_04705 [Omnitrophica bacterium RIFCSPHIGHO2_02_FULL_63_14]